MTDYKPIACSLHDRYEAAAVRASTVTLRWADRPDAYVGRILDIRVQDGAEYLVLEGDVEVRLDHIEAFEEG